MWVFVAREQCLLLDYSLHVLVWRQEHKHIQEGCRNRTWMMSALFYCSAHSLLSEKTKHKDGHGLFIVLQLSVTLEGEVPGFPVIRNWFSDPVWVQSCTLNSFICSVGQQNVRGFSGRRLCGVCSHAGGVHCESGSTKPGPTGAKKAPGTS